MYEEFGLLIDGRWRASGSGKTRPVVDPVDEEIIGHLPSADASDLDEVLAVLAREAPRWAKVSEISWSPDRIRSADVRPACASAL